MKSSSLLIISGPTASGKSGLALQICEAIGGEIISCDSMQIYRGCDIATAKPTREEQARIEHHLIDICEPTERFSAAQWAELARMSIADIERRGKIPVVCGGTGFYLRALLHPEILAEVAPNSTLRAELEAEFLAIGAAAMHEKLADLDAQAAARLHPNDNFRVIRAIEVALGQPQISAPQSPPIPARIFGIEWPREVLYERIGARVDAMMRAGFLDELRDLVEQFGPDAPALGGVGYKQMLPALEDYPRLDECLEIWKRETRRYAKRQLTWFRHQIDVQWLNGEADEMHAVEKILGTTDASRSECGQVSDAGSYLTTLTPALSRPAVARFFHQPLKQLVEFG